MAMFQQPSQIWMRQVFQRGDLALYAKGLRGIKMRLQSYEVTRRAAIWPRHSGRAKNCSLTTSSDFGADDISPTQSSIDFSGQKCLESLSTCRYSTPTKRRMRRRIFQ